MKIVFATNNQHKLEELRRIVGARHTIVSLSEIGCHEDIPETGDTFAENSLQKAQYVYDRYGLSCFADDTGLEVDALGGEPGVRSARYAPGKGHDSRANMELLLKNMECVTDRSARFRTVITLIIDGKPMTFEGIVEGEILTEAAGDGGFGYDPVFRPTGWQKTFAQASPDEKNAVSHRGRAVEKLISYLNTLS